MRAGTGDAVTQSASIGGTGSLRSMERFAVAAQHLQRRHHDQSVLELYANAGGGAITFGSGTHKLTLDFSNNTLTGLTTGDTLDRDAFVKGGIYLLRSHSSS